MSLNVVQEGDCNKHPPVFAERTLIQQRYQIIYATQFFKGEPRLESALAVCRTVYSPFLFSVLALRLKKNMLIPILLMSK